MSYSIYMNDGREIHDYIEAKIAEGIEEAMKNLSIVLDHRRETDYNNQSMSVELRYNGEVISEYFEYM